MKIISLLFALALVSAGCSDSNSTAPEAAPDVIMALKTGNRWIGRMVDNGRVLYDTLGIGGDTTVGSERWARTLMSRISYRPDWIYSPFLIDRADGLYQKDFYHQTQLFPFLHLKFPVALGDTAINYGWFLVTYENGALGPKVRHFGVVTALDQNIHVDAGSFTAFQVDFRTEIDPVDSVGVRPDYDRAWFAPQAGLLKAEKYTPSGAVAYSWELVNVILN